jgi:hypothetical protein
MWSQRAEEIVTRLIAGLSPEQIYPDYTHSARLGALPIGDDLWSSYYLRPNGEVVTVGEDFDNPDADRVYTDEKRTLSTLVWGSRRYPELRELFPERPPGATDCPCLEHPLFAERRIICPECCGMGWLPPEPNAESC